MTLDRREVVSLEIPAGLATVWEHLREPALVPRWYGPDASSDAADAQRFVTTAVPRLDVEHDATTHTLTWPNHDVLSVTAAAHEPHRTHLAVTRRSHDALAVRFDGSMDEVDERWIADVHQLQFALAHQAGQERRTLVVSDADAGDRRSRLLDRAGLHGVRGVPVGGHIQARRPDGTMLGGTLLYKTDHQLGIRLHGMTDALLVVLETPVGSHPPHGAVTAVLSVFGLDETTFTEVASRWQAWWRAAGVREPLLTTG